MNKESIRVHLYEMASYFHKLDDHMKVLITNYVDSIPSDIQLSEEVPDSKAKNAYRLAENSRLGVSKNHWEKIKQYLNNEKE